jgi:hypothetical protein
LTVTDEAAMSSIASSLPPTGQPCSGAIGQPTDEVGAVPSARNRIAVVSGWIQTTSAPSGIAPPWSSP